MKINTYATLTLFLFLVQFSLHAQKDYDYTQYLLPHPDDLSPLFVGALTESAIYYGAHPSNSANKPVLVFVHGFADLANSWFLPGNDIYDRAYDDRYRTAFVATTRGEGMWANGALLGDMLEEITDYYGVNDVVIIAHSNGGKATEVAMFYENKSHLVNRAISLGTPFKGTGIADLAETPALNWLVDFIGLGGGTSTSTTYYMEGVARPILDNEPDNQPSKFINFGGWGYNSGTTLAAPVMFVAGGYLKLAGGSNSEGGNDGVTPYYSSKRPGGSPQWPGYCGWWWCNDESQYDHIDITHDYVIWNAIKPYFTGNVNGFSTPDTEDEQYDRQKTLASTFEVISTKDGYEEAFTIAKEAGQVSINLWHPEEGTNFQILNENLEAVAVNITKSKGHNKGMNSAITLDALQAGTNTIESDVEFAAVVAYEKGAELLFDNANIRHTEGEAITFEAALTGTNQAATITAVLAETADLMGNKVDGATEIIEFELAANGNYTYTLPKGLKAGVYNMTINAVGSDFRRNLVSGFVVIPTDTPQIATVATPELGLQNYPNPVVDQTTITFDVLTEGTTSLSLYDAYGRLVRVETLTNLALGQHTQVWNVAGLASGTYFLELKNGAHKVTQSLVKVSTH